MEFLRLHYIKFDAGMLEAAACALKRILSQPTSAVGQQAAGIMVE